jgi:hypothetical protein
VIPGSRSAFKSMGWAEAVLKIKGEGVEEGKKDGKGVGEVVERNEAVGEAVGKERGKGEEGVEEGRKARAGWVVDRWRECDWIVAASSRSRVGEKEGRGLDEGRKGRLMGNKVGEGGRKTES